MEKMLKKWVVNDYFTPNIKAEVILDTLLTHCIGQLVKEQADETSEEVRFLTKEMSIYEESDGEEAQQDNRGSKIDYVLANRKKVYLVELKTTNSSVNDAQAEYYRNNCQGQMFCDVLGKRLMSILAKSFHVPLEQDPDASLQGLWDAIWEKRASYDPSGTAQDVPETASSYAKKAAWLIKTKGWAQRKSLRSRKYLYTLGQLLDRWNQGFWTKDMEVLYLTPYGTGPQGFRCLSLSGFAERHATSANPYERLLSDIINEIYGGIDTWRN